MSCKLSIMYQHTLNAPVFCIYAAAGSPTEACKYPNCVVLSTGGRLLVSAYMQHPAPGTQSEESCKYPPTFSS